MEHQFFIRCVNLMCGLLNLVEASKPPRGRFGGRCYRCHTLLEG